MGRASEHSADLYSALQWHSTLQTCLPMPCNGMVHCWNWSISCLGKVVWLLLFSCRKKSFFVQLCGWPAAGRPSACWCYYASVTCHRLHIGHQFLVVVGFRPPLQRAACHALGLQQHTETNTLIGW